MGGNYEKGIYNQLMDVMARLDAMENELHTEKREHKNTGMKSGRSETRPAGSMSQSMS